MATLRNAFVCVLSNIVRYKRIFRSLFHHSGSPIVWYERKLRVLSNPLVFDTCKKYLDSEQTIFEV